MRSSGKFKRSSVASQTCRTGLPGKGGGLVGQVHREWEETLSGVFIRETAWIVTKMSPIYRTRNKVKVSVSPGILFPFNPDILWNEVFLSRSQNNYARLKVRLRIVISDLITSKYLSYALEVYI
jgi:hypothetical protein